MPSAHNHQVVFPVWRSLRVGLRLSWIWGVDVAAQLRHIPAHVIQPESVRSQLSHSMQMPAAVVVVPGHLVRVVCTAETVARRAVTATTCRVLPFRLGRQPQPQPRKVFDAGQKRVHLVASHALHGQTGGLDGVMAVHAGAVAHDVIPLLAAYLVASQPKTADGDQMHRRLFCPCGRIKSRH